MKNIILTLVCMFLGTSVFAQNNDAEIKTIQTYIQSTSQNEWFDPINKPGTNANGLAYDLSYYVLADDSVFSIIYTVFDKYTLQKVFYYKQNELIACIVEETDANNANKLLRYADYFFKNGQLINTADENKELPSNLLYAEGVQKLKEVDFTQK
jgi:hypothetical protein